MRQIRWKKRRKRQKNVQPTTRNTPTAAATAIHGALWARLVIVDTGTLSIKSPTSGDPNARAASPRSVRNAMTTLRTGMLLVVWARPVLAASWEPRSEQQT